MSTLKFLAAFLAAFIVADLELNNGRTVHSASLKLSHAGDQLKQAIILLLPRRDFLSDAIRARALRARQTSSRSRLARHVLVN